MMNYSPFSGLVRVIITLVVLGLIIGALSGINHILTAIGEGIDIQNDYKEEINGINLDAYRIQKTIETQSQIDRYQNWTDFQKIAPWVFIGLVVFVALTFYICVMTMVMARYFKNLNTRMAVYQPYNPWDDPQYRTAMLEDARNREKVALAIGNAAHQYKILRVRSKPPSKARMN